MVEYTLEDFEYTFDASAKTITLITKFEDVNIGAIKLIQNVTRNHVMYDVKRGIDPITLSNRVITHTHGNGAHEDTDSLRIVVDMKYADTDEDRVLFSTTSVPAGEVIVSGWFNIEGAKDLFLYIKSTIAFKYYVEVTGDSGANPDGVTLANESGTEYEYTTVGVGDPIAASGKSIPLNIKGAQMRVVGTNDGVSADTPYCEVK